MVWQMVRLFRLLIGSSSYFPSSLFFWEPTGYFPYYCEAAAAVALDNELTFPAFLSEPSWVHKGLTSPNHLSFVAAVQKMANDTQEGSQWTFESFHQGVASKVWISLKNKFSGTIKCLWTILSRGEEPGYESSIIIAFFMLKICCCCCCVITVFAPSDYRRTRWGAD